MMGVGGKSEMGAVLNEAGSSRRPGTFDSESSTTKPFDLILDGSIAVAYLGKRGQSNEARKNAQVSALLLVGLKDPGVAAQVMAGKVGDLLATYWCFDTRPKAKKGMATSWDEFGQMLQGLNHCLMMVHVCRPGDSMTKSEAWAVDQWRINELHERVGDQLRDDESSDDEASPWDGSAGLTVVGATCMFHDIAKTVQQSIIKSSLVVSELLAALSLTLPPLPTPRIVAEGYDDAPDLNAYVANFSPKQEWVQQVMRSQKYLGMKAKAPIAPPKPTKDKAQREAQRERTAAQRAAKRAAKVDAGATDFKTLGCFRHVEGKCTLTADECRHEHPAPDSELFKATLARAKAGRARPGR